MACLREKSKATALPYKKEKKNHLSLQGSNRVCAYLGIYNNFRRTKTLLFKVKYVNVNILKYS